MADQHPSPKKIAIVVQRYGLEVIGGAETLARILAEHLHQRNPGCVDIITTCAQDYETWRNAYPVGISTVNGINVLRFPVVFPRNKILFSLINRMTNAWQRKQSHSLMPTWLRRSWEKFWLICQGPYCPALVHHISATKDRYDGFIFFTYLYYPTVRALPLVKEKAVLIPTAHDEPALYYQIIKDVFSQKFPIIANYATEAHLIQKAFSIPSSRILVGSMGINPVIKSDLPRQSTRQILYLGRIGHAKNSSELIDFVRSYNVLNPQKTCILVLAGALEEGFALPQEDWLKYEGFVGEERKAFLISNSVAVVNPSRFESLSLLVLEAFLWGKPVLASKFCPIFRDYAREVSTLYLYGSFDDFAAALTQLLTQDSADDALEETRSWVLDNFHWEKVRRNLTAALGFEVL